MGRERYWESARRVAAVSVAVVAVIAASVGVTIWRYEVALSRSAAQLDARGDAVHMQMLVGLFWHEREAMREDLLTPSPDVLLEIRAAGAQFAATAATLARDEPPGEARFRAQAAAANRSFLALYIQLRMAAGAKLARDTGANARLDAEPSPRSSGRLPSSTGRWTSARRWRGRMRRRRGVRLWWWGWRRWCWRFWRGCCSRCLRRGCCGGRGGGRGS